MKQVIRFTADWCQPCKAYGPVFNQISSQNPGISFRTVDIDINPESGKKYQVRSVPTTIVLENGCEVRRNTGAMSISQLNSFIS